MEDEKDVPYADSTSGLIRGLLIGIPISLVLWAIIIGAIWLIVTVV